jgi:hypothetical protein
VDTHERVIETTMAVDDGISMDAHDEIRSKKWKGTDDLAFSRKATCPAWNIDNSRIAILS